jgi:WD40 repeat protein/DNA-directed RNA polymerase specialized sigma24 family protein/LysM repeat protein
MSINNLNLDPFSKSTDGFQEDQDPEVEMAFLLQNAQPGDQRITNMLVERYSAELYQLIQAVMQTYREQYIPYDVIQDIVQRTITIAVNEVDQFWGKDSVRNWLFDIAFQQIQKKLPRVAFPGNLIKLRFTNHRPIKNNPDSKEDVKEHCLTVFLNLPRKARLLLILRYLHALNAYDIAQVLASEPQKVVKDLFKSRQALLEIISPIQINEAKNHHQFRNQINFTHDGINPASSEIHTELIEHVESCLDCQDYADQLESSADIIEEICNQVWPKPEYESEEMVRLVELINTDLYETSRLQVLKQPAKKGAWIGILLVLIAAISWGFVRMSLEDDIVMEAPTDVPPMLPEAIKIDAISETFPRLFFSNSDTHISIQPSASGNGRWIAFTVSTPFDRRIATKNSADIFIYDRVSRSLERLRFNESGMEFFSWAYAPWTQVGDEPQPSNNSELGDLDLITPQSSTGVFFYDRDNDQRVRIDLNLDDTESEIRNFYPVISANGQYLAFWSNTPGLSSEESHTCSDVTPRTNCLDVIVLNRQTNEVMRVPVGREIGQLNQNAYLSLSDDGNLLALSIIITDKIARQLDITNSSEAYIFDLLANYYNPVNISDDRSVGNGPSLIPKISADGRHVAFASLADNLVPNDSNREADIFIRDLHTGHTELVSLTTLDHQGTDVGFQTDLYFGFWMDNLSISSNGRYVAILSTLENLTNHYRLGCSPSPEGYCLSIFVHDRLTGDTTQTNSYQLEDHDRIIDISDDGRIVTNFEHYALCPAVSQAQICAEVWQQDRYQSTDNTPRYGYFSSHYTRWIHDTFFDGQEGAANAFSISPDKEIIAIGTKLDTIHLWGIPERERIASLTSNSLGSIYSLDFSPDSEYLAAGSSSGSVYIWHVPTSTRIFSLSDHPGRVIGLRFTPLGDFLIVGTPQQIWVWQKQAETFVRFAVLDYEGNFVEDFALSPDGMWLAVAGEDKTIWIQHLHSQEVVLRLGGHEQELSEVAFSPDSNYLASGDKEGKINIWKLDWSNENTLDAEYQQTLIQPDWVTNLMFSEDESSLASSSFSGSLRLWRLPKGEIMESPPTGRFDFMPNGEFHFDGQLLVAGSSSGLIHVWHSPENITDPNYFFRSDLDEISYIPESPVDPISAEDYLDNFPLPLEELDVNMYEAGGTGVFNVQAPVYIPPGMKFSGARVGPGGIIVFKYEVLDNDKVHPIAQMYISQHNELPLFLIGNHATVERSKVEGRDAEYVEGDWILSVANEHNQWIWNPDAPARRLRWREGSTTFAIHFKSYLDNHSEMPIVTHDDLITIAESMAVLAVTVEPEPLNVNHVVQPGETCASIAEKYNTSIDKIISSNNLDENCERLYNGQELTIPLPKSREPLGEFDLNCDGKPERVGLIPNPDMLGLESDFGIVLETNLKNSDYYEA